METGPALGQSFGAVERAEARGEVIVAAGTVGSAHLLLLSGIGPAAHLRDVGIQVLADLPGVGANLHDHLQCPVVFEAERQLTTTTPGSARPSWPSPNGLPTTSDATSNNSERPYGGPGHREGFPMPSTQWREVFLPDEDIQHTEQAHVFSELQRKRLKKHGHGRALHRNQVAALKAALAVEENLPDYARQGIFAAPAVFEARVRLSNGNFAADRAPDIRGFAIKVLGASTPSSADVEQNFTLVSQETLKVSGSGDVVGIVELSTSAPTAALRKAAVRPRLTRSAVANARDMVKPFSGFATHDFFSIMPITFGEYAARLKLCAASTTINKAARKDLSADIYARLADDDLEFLFQAQFFEDESRTPIEDSSVRWDAPWLTVARLRVPRQAPDEELAETVEKSSFNPWIAAMEHRPLGELMRARRAAYALSWRNRDVAP